MRSGDALNEHLVKTLVGGDTIDARHPYGRLLSFAPTAKFVMRVNTKPKIQDESHGMWRRIRLIPFCETFAVDTTLMSTLESELPGMLNWAIRGCLDWQRNGLQEPENLFGCDRIYVKTLRSGVGGMRMTRLGLLLVGLAVAALPLAAQKQSSTPRFEVASIKPWSPPTTPTTTGVVAAPAGSGIFNRSASVARLIAEAYEVQEFQLSGGEDWVRTERYDVAARAGREVSQTELRDMVKALLADRFKLRVRSETREMPILELRLARNDGRVGPNLHDCSSERVPETQFRPPVGGTVSTSDCVKERDGVPHVAGLVSRRLQTIVVDKTGLTGQWWHVVYFGGELPRIPGVDLSQVKVDPDLPSFETALREQLGLRLVRTRGPGPVMVIESVERPTPN